VFLAPLHQKQHDDGKKTQRESMLRIVAATLFILAITAIWVLIHPIVLPELRNSHVQDDVWRVPDRATPDIPTLVATIEQANLWGGASSLAPVDEKPLTAPNWHIAGVVSIGLERYAMLAIDGQPLQQIKTGENLPGGIKIVNMTADRVCILLNGKKRVLKTYKE
jgi:hypothetical protein